MGKPTTINIRGLRGDLASQGVRGPELKPCANPGHRLSPRFPESPDMRYFGKVEREIKLLFQFKGEQVKFRLEQLETLEKQIAALELQMEKLLVKTPAILLLSIKGISIITAAAAFIAEVGSIFNYTYNRQLVKLAGFNPVLSQSGGKKAKAFKISRQGNPALRYIVTLIGKNLCSKACRNSYFMDYYERLEQRGKSPSQIYAAAGNKFLRIAFAMLKNQTLFFVPGHEECTSDIIGKLSYKETKKTVRQALALLTATANKKRQLLCS